MDNSGEKWGMLMFMGEYHHNIDDKKRLIIPSKFREKLGDKFVVTRGIEKCLFAYSMNDWEQIVSKLQSIPFTKKDARAFNRFFLSSAVVAEFDKQGRITLNSPMVDYASIKHECVIAGVGDRFEIWSVEAWNEFLDSANDDMSDIAENLFNESTLV